MRCMATTPTGNRDTKSEKEHVRGLKERGKGGKKSEARGIEEWAKPVKQ